MRPMFVKGVRPEAFSDAILELHTKRYTNEHIQRENDIAAPATLNSKPKPKGEFSTFGDKTGYNGSVPSGRYFADVFKLVMAELKSHLDREVKKRGAERLHWDASYKEAKHLNQYKGQSIFKVHIFASLKICPCAAPPHLSIRHPPSMPRLQALITATNEHGEIRIQFHVVTDGHDQMLQQIKAMLETMEQYGQPQPKMLVTDDPARDSDFMLAAMPSLRVTHENLKDSVPPPPNQVREHDHVRV